MEKESNKKSAISYRNNYLERNNNIIKKIGNKSVIKPAKKPTKNRTQLKVKGPILSMPVS